MPQHPRIIAGGSDEMKRRDLVQWLRERADYIERGEISWDGNALVEVIQVPEEGIDVEERWEENHHGELVWHLHLKWPYQRGDNSSISRLPKIKKP